MNVKHKILISHKVVGCDMYSGFDVDKEVDEVNDKEVDEVDKDV
jgi:hypothetical protein